MKGYITLIIVLLCGFWGLETFQLHNTISAKNEYLIANPPRGCVKVQQPVTELLASPSTKADITSKQSIGTSLMIFGGVAKDFVKGFGKEIVKLKDNVVDTVLDAKDAFFTPASDRDCVLYIKEISEMPFQPVRALMNLLSQIFITPFELIFGSAGKICRQFLDRFNVAEKLFACIFLLILLLIFTLIIVFMIWTGRNLCSSNPVYIHTTPQKEIAC